jgi:predicted  nucleic acid-binding Zn-ribbon protein
MSDTLSLYRLQQIDTQMDRARAELLTIQKSLEDDAELGRAIDSARATEAECVAAKKDLKQAEADLQAQRIKIEQTEASLYGGTVRNPKELRDLQDDAASMKRYMLTLEDRLLAAMERAEKAEAEFSNAAATLANAQEHWDAQKRDLDQRQQVFEKEYETHQLERHAVAEALSPESLVIYEKLRQERRGVAVAVIRENACAACGSTLSAAQIQGARSPSQMAHCPSCGRILYGS